MCNTYHRSKEAAIAAAMTHLKYFKNLDTVYVQHYPITSTGPMWMLRHHKPDSDYTPIDRDTVAKFGHLYGRAV